MRLRREQSEIDVSEHIERLPEEMQKTLGIVKEEDFVAIKGGYAKALFELSLVSLGEIKEGKALSYKVDLDMMMTFVGTRRKSLPILVERYTALENKLLSAGIVLSPEDIEIVKGNFNDSKTIIKILESRDLTINEVLLIYNKTEQKWFLYHTNMAYRDTIQSVGILAANRPGTLRSHHGIRVPAPYGIVRLIRYLVERKVQAIYLPKEYIQINNSEAKRLGKPNLGAYGLILSERYEDDPVMQKRFMQTLKKLGLTNIESFQEWRTNEMLSFSKNGREFELTQTRSFLEVQQHFIGKEDERKSSQQERKAARIQCEHREMHKIQCFLCGGWIRYCKACGHFVPDKRHWNCNQNFLEANFYWDKGGFFPFFPKN